MLASSGSSRRYKRNTTSSWFAGAGGYNLAAVIAALRAGTDAARWTDTTDPFAPSGLQLPTAPTITSTVNVSTLADLRTALGSGTGKHIILAPGTYSETTRTIFDVGTSAVDFKITVTGCTLNITGNYHSYTTHWNSSRIEIVGGTWNAIPQIDGTDIKVTGGSYVGDNLAANPDANGSGLGVNGIRVCVAGAYWRGYNGLFFTGATQKFDGTATISGTTLTVTATYTGALSVGMSVIDGYSGTPVATKTRIVASLGGGQWQVSVSQTRADLRINAFARSTNVIAANSIFECPVSATGNLHENPTRFNAAQFGLVVDCRLWGELKHTMRNTADYTHEFSSGLVGFVRVQAERQGVLMTGGNAGVYPFTETTIFDAVKMYRDGGQAGLGIDAQAVFNLVGLSGDGATVSAIAFAQQRHNLTTGDTVTINAGGTTPAGFNGTYAITVTGDKTFTYANTQTGTYGGTQNDYVGTATVAALPGNDLIIMRNCESFSAPTEGTAGLGWVPGGVGSPDAGWTTCSDAATSLSNGNARRTEVTPPAWSIQ